MLDNGQCLFPVTVTENWFENISTENNLVCDSFCLFFIYLIFRKNSLVKLIIIFGIEICKHITKT